ALLRRGRAAAVPVAGRARPGRRVLQHLDPQGSVPESDGGRPRTGAAVVRGRGIAGGDPAAADVENGASGTVVAPGVPSPPRLHRRGRARPRHRGARALRLVSQRRRLSDSLTAPHRASPPSEVALASGAPMRIDLNSDLGESFGRWTLGSDAELMKSITSANVACGFHAGDPGVMRDTVRMARDNGVAVGAHPGLPDLAGFGRRNMAVSAAEVENRGG